MNKILLVSLLSLTSFSAFADDSDPAACQAIQTRIAELQSARAQVRKGCDEDEAKMLRMKAIVANSYDRSLGQDPQVVAAFNLVQNHRNNLVDAYNEANAQIRTLTAQYKQGCAAVVSLSSLSDSSLLAKASKNDLGKCVIEQTEKTNCPLKVVIDGRGFPIGDGCQASLAVAASVLRDALKDGQCL